MSKKFHLNIFLTICMFILFYIWWNYFAFIYTKGKSPIEYNFIFGLPDWFFYSVILGYLIFNIFVYILVNYFFKD